MRFAIALAFTAGLTFLVTSLCAVTVDSANAAMSEEQAYKQCRKELRGIGGGRGSRERRFRMIEDCVRRKRA